MADFFSGLVSGTMQGMDWREGREDRKRQRKMDDEEHTWRRQDQEWRNEDRAYTREERARRRKEEDRLIKQREAELEAWNKTVDDMINGTASDVSVSTSDRKAPPDFPIGSGTPLSYGDLSVKQAPPASSGAPSQVAAPAPDAPVALPATVDPTAPRIARVTAPSPERAPVNKQAERGEEAPPGRGEKTLLDQAVESAVANERASERDAEPRRTSPATRQEEEPPSKQPLSIMDAAVAAAQANAEAKRRGVPVVADAAPGVPVAPTPVQEVAAAPAPVVSGPGDTSGAFQAQRPQAPDQAPGKPQAAPATPQGTPVASLEVAARSAPPLSFGIIGKDAPVKTTKARLERAVDAGVTAYRKEKMPAIKEHYLRTGQLDKAEAWDKYVEDERTQKAMRSWMGAVHALGVGDTDRFIDGITETYNTGFDDGYTALRDQSEFVTDDNGNLVSAKIAFRSEETGEVFVQEFDSTQDLLMTVIGKLSPEGMFDTLYDMHMAPKPSTKAPELTAVIASLAKSNPEFAMMPLEQQAAIAQQYIATGQLGGGATITADDLSD